MSVRGNDRPACMRTRVGAKGGQPQVTRAQQGRGWGAGMRGAVGPMGKDEVSRRERVMNEWVLVDDEEVGLVGSIDVERGDG